MLTEAKKKEILEKVENLTADDLLERFKEFGSEYIGPYTKESKKHIKFNTNFEFTIPFMNSTDWKDRLIAEYFQTKMRYRNLLNGLASDTTSIRKDEVSYMQAEAMSKYLMCLRLRCIKEGIDLSKPFAIKEE